MSYADLRIVALILLFVTFYGVFNYLKTADEIESHTVNINTNNTYNTPTSAGFFDTISAMSKINTNQPELMFLNVTIFFVFGALVVFIILRFFRGTG